MSATTMIVRQYTEYGYVVATMHLVEEEETTELFSEIELLDLEQLN